jgi:DNA-directed RNA polymerase subunit F
MTNEEDEAWNHMQRVESLNRKRQIENQMRELTEEMTKIRVRLGDLEAKTPEEFYNELRNGVIEEVAQHVEKLKGFGHDTMSSFAIYIRDLKQ